MLRTFREHDVRVCESLAGRWDFITATDKRTRKRLPTSYNRTIQVPSAWESLPGLETYRGTAWLRRSVETCEGLALRLVFGGVSHTGTVFLDGKKIGQHYDAFTPWDVVAPAKRTGEAELVVEVDNSFGDHSALHIENDYYTYGGITRPVVAEYVPPVYIDRLHAKPVRRGKTWDLEVAMRLHNWSAEDGRRQVEVAIANETLRLGRVTVKAGGARTVKGVVKGLKVRPWTAERPQLYELAAYLLDGKTIVDDQIDRIGFRQVEVRGKKILLNGSSIRLRGYNRHEDHPQFGCALPVEAMAADLDIMRDLGCNFVRTCHYPNDLRFLDLCDELGFYVWEESHARTVAFDHPMFREQIRASTEEMIDWHYNRPSIVIWGCLNECDSVSAQGAKEHKRVLDLIKKADRSRPVTFASNQADRDRCLGYVDIVSWNRYDAWYGGGPEDVEPRLKRVLKWLHAKASKGGKGKPVILSEFGGGAIYGNRQTCKAKWSEEYQSDCLDECLRVYLNHPAVAGAAIWQFCDVRLTENWWQRRPRNMNNKGTVDEYRRPKLAYPVVKARMHEARRKHDRRK